MRPQVVMQTGVGASNPIRLNYRQTDFRVSLFTEVTGTATYTIQICGDDPATFTSISDYNTNANWFNTTLTDLVNATDNQTGNIFFPVQSIRINVTAGAGSVELTALQGNAT